MFEMISVNPILCERISERFDDGTDERIGKRMKEACRNIKVKWR